MKALRILWIVFLFVGVVSCNKKEYPKPVVVENTALYYSLLTIDNTPVELKAGVNGYYMYSSYQLDSNFVYTFTGELKQTDCSNCINSLKIQINDYKVSLTNPSSTIDSSLRSKAYPILSGSPVSSFFVKFTPSDSMQSTYKWKFGDGTESAERNPVKEYTHSKRYNVCLTTTALGSNYVSTICNKENISENPFRTTISATPLSGNNIAFTSSTTGKVPAQYLWNFGNGLISTQPSLTVNYSYRGSYPVTLRVVDNLGDTAYASYNAKTSTDISSSTANYSITTIKTVPPPPVLSKVIITWTDANGVVYSSNDEAQPANSTFEILSVEDNGKNENQQATKKITAKFNCKLYNGSKSITMNNAEVVMCVAYKE